MFTRVSWKAYYDFCLRFHQGKYSGCRFGQAFMNHLQPSVADPEIYYEKDEKKATKLITDRYVGD